MILSLPLRGRLERWVAIATMVLPLVLFEASILHAQAVTVDRQYEFVQMSASSFTAFSGDAAAVDDLFLYAFRNGTWQQIPFQFDERDASNSYFGSNDGLLDDNDQFLFMARDAGDQAPLGDWIGDASARSFPRYEIQLFDLVTSQSAYVYLQRSSTLNLDPSVQGYMAYAATPASQVAADTVRGMSYIQGHAGNGVPNYLAVKPSFGGTGVDFLDRLKLRIRATVPILGVQTLNEQDNMRALPGTVRHVVGRIRVIREAQEELRVFLFGNPVPVDTPAVTLIFYPFSSQVTTTIPLTSTVNARLLRASLDFNTNVVNQTWHNKNAGPRTITGASGGLSVAEAQIDTLPKRNWFLMGTNHGSFIGILGLQHIPNVTQQYYFWDSASNSFPDLTTVDTGESGSFGDTGFMVTSNSAIVATFRLEVITYFLAPNLARSQAEALKTNSEQALAAISNAQTFDAIPPAAVNNLQVATSTNTSVTLNWTAPSDAGSSLSRYLLAYSTTAIVGADTLNWFNNVAQQAANLPSPGAAGTPETATVEGLTTGAKYYFVLRSQDQFGNLSGFSNVASIDAVPVELSTFTISIAANQAELRWTTASETNNLGFYVERKKSEETLWTELGFVAGHGTTTQEQIYSFADSRLQPAAYRYRLRQVDFDGKFEYSPEVATNVGIPARFSLAQNYPNPLALAGNATIIKYELSNAAPVKVELRVFNLLGREVTRLVDEDQAGGYYEARWDGRLASGEHVPAGVYFYELRAGGARQIRKLTLLR